MTEFTKFTEPENGVLNSSYVDNNLVTVEH